MVRKRGIVSLFRALPVVAVFLLVACAHFNPTPSLFKQLAEENNKTVALYAACSEAANYTPEKEGCDPEALESQIQVTMDVAKDFISGDIKQPHGYTVYLETAMVRFRIAQRTRDEYSEAEKIARQFFEVQKASSGKSINAARYYWVLMTTGHASWQFYNDPLSLDANRKVELIACVTEGQRALEEGALDPPRHRMLSQAIQVLVFIIGLI